MDLDGRSGRRSEREGSWLRPGPSPGTRREAIRPPDTAKENCHATLPGLRVVLALAVVAASAGSTQAAWNNVFEACCWGCQHNEATANYPPPPSPCAQPCQPQCTTHYVQRCYYQPVTTYKQRSYYEPVTTYRTSYYYEPVTSYRYSCYYDPCTCQYQQVATPVTSYKLRSQCCPVTSYLQRCYYQPVTQYQQAFYYEPVTTLLPDDGRRPGADAAARRHGRRRARRHGAAAGDGAAAGVGPEHAAAVHAAAAGQRRRQHADQREQALRPQPEPRRDDAQGLRRELASAEARLAAAAAARARPRRRSRRRPPLDHIASLRRTRMWTARW